MTDHAILTPMLVVISMVTGDFLAMSSTTDNVRPSPKPNAWRIGSLTLAGLIIGIFDLIFCVAVLAFGKYRLGLNIGSLRTLTMVTLVFSSGQAVFYVVRERKRLWSSRPSLIVILCSMADCLIVPTMAVGGLLMDPLPISIVVGIFLVCIALALALDQVKLAIFAQLRMMELVYRELVIEMVSQGNHPGSFCMHSDAQRLPNLVNRARPRCRPERHYEHKQHDEHDTDHRRNQVELR